MGTITCPKGGCQIFERNVQEEDGDTMSNYGLILSPEHVLFMIQKEKNIYTHS